MLDDEKKRAEARRQARTAHFDVTVLVPTYVLVFFDPRISFTNYVAKFICFGLLCVVYFGS